MNSTSAVYDQYPLSLNAGNHERMLERLFLSRDSHSRPTALLLVLLLLLLLLSVSLPIFVEEDHHEEDD